MRRPVYDGVAVGGSFEDALARFGAAPEDWLPAPATPHADGHVVLMHATGLLATTGVPAVVEVGAVDAEPSALAIRSVAWRSLNADRIFPRLVGDLELTRTSASTARLTLVGSYMPPISVVGGAADRLLGHHVAEAVIRTFLEKVAARLTGVAAATSAAP